MLVCLFCFSAVDLSFIYISVWICKRYLQDFLATVSFVACSVLNHSVQKPLTSCSRQKNKTKQNKTKINKTTQKTNRQTKNMCLYVTAHVLYNPSKSTAYENSRCSLAYQNRFSDYYTKDKS